MRDNCIFFFPILLGICASFPPIFFTLYFYVPAQQKVQSLTCGYCNVVNVNIEKRYMNSLSGDNQTSYWQLSLTVQPFGDQNFRCCYPNVTAQQITFYPSISAFTTEGAARKRIEKWQDILIPCSYDVRTGLIEDMPNTSIWLTISICFGIVALSIWILLIIIICKLRARHIDYQELN